MVFPLGGEVPDRQVFIFCYSYYSQNHLFFNEVQQQAVSLLSSWEIIPYSVLSLQTMLSTAEILGSFTSYV